MTEAKQYEVAVLRGGPEDESGPEMMDAAMQVLGTMLADAGLSSVKFVPLESGKHCVKTTGQWLPDESLKKARELGVVFKAPGASATSSLEDAVSRPNVPKRYLRHELKVYANVTPSKSYKGVTKAIRQNIDLVIVRENMEGLLQSPFFEPAPGVGCNIRIITREGSARVARVAFQLAQRRRKKVTVCALQVAGAIGSERLFIEGCFNVAKEFPDVEVEVRKPDSLAGTLVDRPDYYDVIVAPNDWGYIISDVAVAATGSVGLGPRANYGDNAALFEPVHGTAPGKAGKGTVNPISQILAGKMMLEYLGYRHDDEELLRLSRRLERAVTEVLDGGKTLTVDLGGSATTRQMVEAVIERSRALSE
ncbi:MAG: isocitrate/isopropylmalate family dehydrogenase [Dehalococcoidia bacterium]|nr:isocitrate/isopropylmalate family dehydrogenase [Dehalococcoidia bacterium]